LREQQRKKKKETESQKPTSFAIAGQVREREKEKVNKSRIASVVYKQTTTTGRRIFLQCEDRARKVRFFGEGEEPVDRAVQQSSCVVHA